MKLAALISGGKDSLVAAYKAAKDHELVCLISIKSKNQESYMFHIPNIEFVKLQAEAMDLPIIFAETEGIKEEELLDLKNTIKIAIKKYDIQGIVTGAIESNYQKQRIDKICSDLDIKSIAPLWHTPQLEYARSIPADFEVIVTAIAADGLDESDLGKKYDFSFIEKLQKTKVNLVGEGGEFETFVLDCPIFKKKIVIKKSEKSLENKYIGQYKIKKAALVNK